MTCIEPSKPVFLPPLDPSGVLARQLESSLSSVVEHILHTDGVSGSNPLASTSLRPATRGLRLGRPAFSDCNLGSYFSWRRLSRRRPEGRRRTVFLSALTHRLGSSSLQGMKYALFAAALLCLPSASAESAKETWNELIGEKMRTHPKLKPAFEYVDNDAKLPNVLIYGDSISIGYTQRVRDNLKGKANVYRLHANGSSSGAFIGLMKKMHTAMQNEKLDKPWTHKWDVIHFNVGLHDLKYVSGNQLDKKNGKQVSSAETYEKNLKAIIAYLKELSPEAKLIFCTTTPVPENSKGRVAGDAAKYNEVALKVMKRHPEIAINDLFSFTKPKQKEWWSSPGNVHFTKKGTDSQGDEVARVISKALEK